MARSSLTTEAARPSIVGIVNLTEDSFSDGGQFLKPAAAVAHARNLAEAGADIIDLGAASSHPDSKPVTSEEEIRRLEGVLKKLEHDDLPLSIDSCQPAVQEFALARDVSYLNDIKGFAYPELYPALARADCQLVIMFSVLGADRAGRTVTDPDLVFADLCVFFEERTQALESAGVARDRMILDPGMGFFLGSNPETSIAILRKIPEIRAGFELPVFVSVSRKSFLGAITGRDVDQRAAATLAAELFAARQGAAFLRTHAPGKLRDALLVQERLEG